MAKKKGGCSQSPCFSFLPLSNGSLISSRNFTKYQSRGTLRILYRSLPKKKKKKSLKSFPISRGEWGCLILRISFSTWNEGRSRSQSILKATMVYKQ